MKAYYTWTASDSSSNEFKDGWVSFLFGYELTSDDIDSIQDQIYAMTMGWA